MRVPYVDLGAQTQPLRDRLLEAVALVLEHGQYILGPEVEELEERLCERLGVAHAITVNSGTDAIALALKVADIGPGDDVLTVSHSFFATASAIELAGARPVFVDLDARTMLMDPDDLEAALTPKTRAVLPVHLNGFPCEIDRIGAFCDQHGLRLIEDCAQAFGTRFHGRSVGSSGLGCFSLHPLKVFPAGGDGGFITTNDSEIAQRLRRMRNIGLRDRDHCVEVAGNSRLDTMQAAMLLVKLDFVDDWITQRRAHAEAYSQLLADLVTLPPDEDTDHSTNWSSFVIRHPDRDRILAALADAGVEAKIHYPIPIHRQEAFAHLLPGRPLPVTDEVVSTMLSLPVTPQMTDAQRSYVAEALVHVVQGAPTR